LAYREGGAGEIVEEGKTGELFDDQVAGVIANVVRKFLEQESWYSRKYIVQSGQKYSKDRFINDFKNVIDPMMP
jgi:hypothetical protein